MSAARIGKVTLKASGTEVRVLHRQNPNPNGENWRGKIVDSARLVASYDEHASELVGYLMVGFYSDGSSSVGFRYDPAKSPIPRALMPAYVGELVRRDMVTALTADEVAVEVYNRTMFDK